MKNKEIHQYINYLNFEGDIVTAKYGANAVMGGRSNTEGSQHLQYIEMMTREFNLKGNMTYFSQNGRVAGTEVWENGKKIASQRFENDGYDAVLGSLLAQGVNPYCADSVKSIYFYEDKGIYEIEAINESVEQTSVFWAVRDTEPLNSDTRGDQQLGNKRFLTVTAD